MSKTVITLHISDTSVKVLAARGKRIRRWHEMPLESGLVKDGVVTDPPKLALKIKDMLQALEMNAREVVVGMSGVHCLFRVVNLPRVAASILEQAVRREAEMALPVPPEQVYLRWQVLDDVGDEIEVFVAALPRNTVDSLTTTLRLVGLKAREIEPAPLCVARATDRATAIAADIRATEADIVVMTDGVPQLVRSLAYPGDALTVQEKLLAVGDEMARAFSFSGASGQSRQSRDLRPLQAELPVLVSGDLVHEEPARQFLAGEIGRAVQPLQYPFRYPEGFIAGCYVVGAGLALRKLRRSNRAGHLRVRLNAIPDVGRLSLRAVLAVAGRVAVGLAAVALIVYLGLAARENAQKTGALQVQLDAANLALERRVTQQQAEKRDEAALKKKVSDLQTTYDGVVAQQKALDGVFSDLGVQREKVNGEISLAVSARPAGVELTRLSRSQSMLTVQGLAPGSAEVLDYADALRGSGRFTQVVVYGVQRTDLGTRFTLNLVGKE